MHAPRILLELVGHRAEYNVQHGVRRDRLIIRHVIAREKDFPFLNFRQINSDVHRVSSHPLYAYKRGPSYGRLMAVINLILAMETLNVQFQEK